MGFVDTHIHLLPGLDDGPAHWEDALAMAEVAIADGISHVVATPHANYQFGFAPERVGELRDRMQATLGERLEIASGCELHLSYENVQAVIENPRLYSLNGGRYLLVEFPEFFERGALGKILERFCELGLIPVLAHPERNPVFLEHPESLLEYLRQGCISQVTAASFLGRFGKRAQQYAGELLEREWIHIVASDGHSAQQRPPHLGRAHAFIEDRRGAGVAHSLCSANPMAVLNDEELPYLPELPSAWKKSLWSRLRSQMSGQAASS